MALTFDDGPHPVFTPRLLTVLKRHGARATFFMVGSSAHRHPDVVRQVAADGHAIGNHSWSHPSMPLISRRERRRQVRDCADALAPYGQRLFRPPYGNQTLASRLELTWLRHAVIGWSRSARDSSTDDAGQIVARLRERIRPGDIILFHDALHDAVHERYFDRGYAVDAVDHLLRDLGGGFEFVSVPELLRLGRPRYASFFGRPDVALLNSLSTATGVPRRYADGSAGRVEPS